MIERNDEKEKPDFDELQKDLAKLFSDKYGFKNIKMNFPQADYGKEKDGQETTEKTKIDLEFDYKPRDIKAYLDRFVVKQDEAKKVLSVAVCDHYNHVKACINTTGCGHYTKQNVLIIGPTGVGKTYLIKTIADLVGVPFVKADATKFSETGYVGGDVDDLVRELVQKANGDIKLAEYGIIYIDEVDKISAPAQVANRDVSGQGVQRGLLKLMEETEVPLKSPLDMVSQMQSMMEFQKKGKVNKKTINTRHILFIVSGAFEGLIDIIKKRLVKQHVGFAAKVQSFNDQLDYLKQSTSKDFIQFGFEPEFIGRLPVRVVCNELESQDLYTILKFSEGSIINQYRETFKAYGLDVYFSDSGLRELAELSIREKTGARGLITVCERILRDFKFELPSHDVKRFIVNKPLVDTPQKTLKKIINNHSFAEEELLAELITDYENIFFEKHEIHIHFHEDAIKKITDKAIREEKNVEEICDELLRNFDYGLNLIKKNSGKDDFLITHDVIDDPSGVLNEWIQKSFK